MYVLQKESLLRFSTKERIYSKFIFNEEFNFNAFNTKSFSIHNDKLLLTDGNNLRAFSFEESENTTDIICTPLVITYPENWDYNSIAGLYSFDGEFYLLKNKTIDNIQNVLIIKLHYNKTTNTYQINPNDYVLKEEGIGLDFTLNAFGDLYLMLKENGNNKKIVCYDIINKKFTKEPIPFAYDVKKIFCDFENLYCLENETIYNLTSGTSYAITKNLNLGNELPISTAVDLTCGKTYLLYKGFILQTTDLPLTSPNSFKIPQNLYSKYYETIKTYKLNDGAKLFEVDANEEYFNYKNVTSSKNLEYIYVSDLAESPSFCIINLEYKTYIARTSDLIITNPKDENSNLATTFTPNLQEGYYVTRAGVYGLPILNYDQYDTTTQPSGLFRLNTIGAYTKVEILGGIIINSEKFYLVKFSDNSLGYIQQEFIVEKVNYYLADVSATTVYDINGVEIGTISPRKVKVYGRDKDMFVIDYNNTYGYVSLNAINTETANRDSFFLANIKDSLFTPLNGTIQDAIPIKAQQVKVYGIEDGKYIIEYLGQYGYVDEANVIKPKNNAIKNSLIVIIVATSFLATGLYLQIKFNRKEDI